jgi:hypothetical protein
MSHSRRGRPAWDAGTASESGNTGESYRPLHNNPDLTAQVCTPCALRGADLESSLTLLERVAARLAGHAADLAAASGEDVHDDMLWALSSDLSALIPLLEVLIDREKYRPSSTGG